jgi:hypothetical protein
MELVVPCVEKWLKEWNTGATLAGSMIDRNTLMKSLIQALKKGQVF